MAGLRLCACDSCKDVRRSGAGGRARAYCQIGSSASHSSWCTVTRAIRGLYSAAPLIALSRCMRLKHALHPDRRARGILMHPHRCRSPSRMRFVHSDISTPLRGLTATPRCRRIPTISHGKYTVFPTSLLPDTTASAVLTILPKYGTATAFQQQSPFIELPAAG
jgi:hypothetical protein